ncbi:MAG: hypothetical protein LBE47_00055 [Methanomassiliicoccaceae archaeon]|jgi:peptidoglycan/LPS O-acetylase OafA/YrhL|nr:hypothetical protein [Methanomassiliicoccaceae archaeon]
MAIVLMVFLTKMPVTDKILSKGGRMSYEIYLVHWTLLVVVRSLNIGNLWIEISFGVALSIIVAYAAHLLSEAVLRNYKRIVTGTE